MAYCRWSSDNFRCDIYAYESDRGYCIHVAGGRYLGDIPQLPNFDSANPAKFWDAYAVQYKFLETATTERIALPYAGESFIEPDLAALEARLLELREIGYRFPDYVLEDIRAEIAEGHP